MPDFTILLVHLFRLFSGWRVPAVCVLVAESVLIKHQLLIVNGARTRRLAAYMLCSPLIWSASSVLGHTKGERPRFQARRSALFFRMIRLVRPECPARLSPDRQRLVIDQATFVSTDANRR